MEETTKTYTYLNYQNYENININSFSSICTFSLNLPNNLCNYHSQIKIKPNITTHDSINLI